jgi:hypothetical protein
MATTRAPAARFTATVAGATLAAALAACGDVDAPTAAPSFAAGASPNHSVSSTSSITSSGSTTTTTTSTSGTRSSTSTSGSTVTVTVYPNSTVTMTVGSHRLRLPAGTICAPSSSYGATEWDKPCATSTSGVTITAKATVNASGHARVDFSPRLRFKPNAGGQVVTLYLLDKGAVAAGGLTVLYCADDALACIDESSTDASVATQTDATNGYLYRRLKHFSGYSIGVGRSDEGMF